MAVALERRPFDADVHDADDVRAVVMAEIASELKLKGEPHPRVVLVGDGFADVLDLHRVATTEPGAHLGATLAIVRRLPGIEHVFVVVQLHAESEGGQKHTYALLAELTEDDTRWFALPYETDERSGIGAPGEWSETDADFVGSIEVLRDLFDVPVDAVPATVLHARKPTPDIKAAFFELPATVVLPTDAKTQADLAVRVAIEDLLKGQVTGTVVVKQAGYHGEMWVIADLNGDLDDAVRSIAAREPVAEGLAVVLLALWEGSEPPHKGVQIVAERGTERIERWILLDFPDGPSASPAVSRVLERVLPVDEGDGWLGVPADTALEFFALGPEA